MPHQNYFNALASLLVRKGHFDEIWANRIGSRTGGGLLDDLNLHSQSLHSRVISLTFSYKIAVLPKVIQRDVNQPRPDGALLLRVFLAVHCSAPFVPTFVAFQS
jgi:hypothetical protein